MKYLCSLLTLLALSLVATPGLAHAQDGEVGYEASLYVADEIVEDTLEIGMDPEATDGYDTTPCGDNVPCDLSAPPAPPAGAFDARIAATDANGNNDYFRDIRALTPEEIFFRLSYQATEDQGPIVLTWNPAELDAIGDFVIVDQQTGGENFQLDMTKQNSLNTAVECGPSFNPNCLAEGLFIRATANQSALPVELTSFTSTVDGQEALLRWKTASETNNAGFEVQKKTDDNTWEKVTFVEGASTTTEAQSYRYRADDLAPGRHTFRLKQVDFDGAFTYSAEVEAAVELADTYQLTRAHPNPFNPQTRFTLTVQQRQTVTVDVYNMLGRRVTRLHEGALAANTPHRFTFDAASLPSGLYLIRVTGETFGDVRQATLVK